MGIPNSEVDTVILFHQAVPCMVCARSVLAGHNNMSMPAGMS